mgnify:CR=1 FL=1
MLRVFLEDEISEFHYTVETGTWSYALKSSPCKLPDK